MINIEVNGHKLELNDGAVLRDALEAAKAFYFPGTTAGILKAGTKKEEATSEYKILTTKGEFRIELAGEHGIWTRFNREFINTGAHWDTPDSIAFIMLQHTDNRNLVENEVMPSVMKRYPKAKIKIQPLSLTTGVHAGPGTWSIAYIPEI